MTSSKKENDMQSNNINVFVGKTFRTNGKDQATFELKERVQSIDLEESILCDFLYREQELDEEFDEGIVSVIDAFDGEETFSATPFSSSHNELFCIIQGQFDGQFEGFIFRLERK